MPTETPSNAADPSRRIIGGAADRSTRTWQFVGVTTLAGVIALTAVAVPWLLASDDSRRDEAAAPAATGNLTHPATSSVPSTHPTSAGPTTQGTATAAEPAAPSSEPASDRSVGSVTSAPPPVAPAPASPSAAAPDRSTAAAPFSPVSVEAEDPANLLSEGAGIASCAACGNGARVRYVGRLTAYLTTATGGSRTITVRYTVKGDRTIKISINGAAPTAHHLTGTDWDTPRTLRYTAMVPAGRVSMAFYNDTGPAPDIDKITIS
ncbi:hypothetical protein [Verrucosispora sp. WMMD573]|uniref:hypothetical protein n=1 Tax=Verrucosispora sp. WMMD573 TaxID=3015149 RepID=UPI00248C241F|nr:hypothetical protein [Verrucosispora sp. WMMD573]WBB55258.1 hypothetical protein O7601_03790 [Verrucosispora sp. WMMD573]